MATSEPLSSFESGTTSSNPSSSSEESRANLTSSSAKNSNGPGLGFKDRESRDPNGPTMLSMAVGPAQMTPSYSARTVATHKHPVEAAMLAVIVIEAGFVQ